MTTIFYWFYRFSIWTIGLIPFPILYKISDALAFLLHHVIGYRRKVVEGQLRKCFPDWSEEKLKKVVKLSYLNLTDILLESFKTPSLSREEMMTRYYVNNPDLANDLYKSYPNTMAVAAHTSNWEWGSVSLNYFLDTHIYGLYKPLVNPKIDRYIKAIRKSAGTTMISIKETRTLFDEKLDPPGMVVFVADQSPSNIVDAIWLDFLGQDTACLHGPEKYASQTGWPVLHLHMHRVKRGYYEVNLSILDKDKPITQQFMSGVEEDIKQRPHEWLWTHKRWKRRREEAELQKKKRAARASKA